MPWEGEHDTQPLKGKTKPNRKYIRATWDAEHAPGDSPKIDGGVTIDQNGNVIPTRAYNRHEQLYFLPFAVIQSRRFNKANIEEPDYVILKGPEEQIEIRSISGNNYDIRFDGPSVHCDCPDWLRQSRSYPTETPVCKHIIAYVIRIGKLGDTPLEWSPSKVAEALNLEEGTVQGYCREGKLFATMQHKCWKIPEDVALAFITYWKEFVEIGGDGTDVWPGIFA